MINNLYGYSLSIYNNGKIFNEIFGYKEVKPNKSKVTKQTLWDIASLTKTFTSVLVFITYEAGKLSIEDKIIDFDPNFNNLKDIKIKDLLSHNQEIWTDGYIGDAKNKNEYLKILYSSYVKNKKPTYVDIDYIILAHLLEIIYKMPFDKIIEEKIIKLLNLKNTTFNPTKNIASTNYEKEIDQGHHLGEIHDKKARFLKKIGIITGHAGLFTTSEDLLQFLTSILNYKIIKRETLSLMLEHYDINLLNAKNNWDCKTYNFMGSRYYNNISEKNDVPAPGNIVSFSGYTGPRYLIDFDNNIIIVLMCSIVHNSNFNRDERFNITKNIVYDIYNEVKKLTLFYNSIKY